MNSEFPSALPTFNQLMFPTLQALGDLGGSANVGELVDRIASNLRLSEAAMMARRDGAPPVELIDGDTLCDLLKEFGIGVSTEMVERVRVDGSVFETI